MFVITQSSIMLFLLIAVVSFILKKLKRVNTYNTSLLLIFTGFWISVALLGSTLMNTSSEPWKFPIIVGASQLTQAFVRLPIGKLSQKLQSRKIPLLMALVIMVTLSFPLLFTISFTSILFAAIGMGVFGATFGLQNQYWSENYDMKNVFITVALIFVTTFVGKYSAAIISETITIEQDTIKWVMTGFISVAVVVASIYAIFLKEDQTTIMLDNKNSYAKDITTMKLKHVLIFSIMITFATLAYYMLEGSRFVNQQLLIIKLTGYTVSIVVALITALLLVRFFDDRVINNISQLFMMLGFSLMAISTFSVGSTTLSFVGLMIALAGLTAFTISMMGMMLHIDHKNTLLVLGIWLTIKSLFIATGRIIGGEVQVYSSHMNYLIIVAIVLVAISLVFGQLVYKKYTKPGFDLIETLEFGDNSTKQNPAWY